MKMPSEACLFQTAFDFQGVCREGGAVSGMPRRVRIFPANFLFGRKPYISRLPIRPSRSVCSVGNRTGGMRFRVPILLLFDRSDI